MTSLVFQDWLITFNKLIRINNPQRKILLLLDNAGSHSIHGLELRNIVIKFLPPNTTSKLQPLEAGIIANFKSKYRTHFIRFLINEIDRNGTKGKLDILGAIRFVVKSWNEVSATTIRNCWFHTKLIEKRLPEITEIEEAIDPMPINELNLDNPMTTNEYIDFSEARIIEDSIDKECDTPVINEEEDEEIDDSSVEPKIVNSEAENSCKLLINYFEQQNCDYSSHFKALHKFNSDISKIRSESLRQTSILDYLIKN
jgi:hypothetical protein